MISVHLKVITEDGEILQGHPEKVIKMEAFQTLFASHQLSFDPERKKFILNCYTFLQPSPGIHGIYFETQMSDDEIKINQTLHFY